MTGSFDSISFDDNAFDTGEEVEVIYALPGFSFPTFSKDKDRSRRKREEEEIIILIDQL